LKYGVDIIFCLFVGILVSLLWLLLFLLVKYTAELLADVGIFYLFIFVAEILSVCAEQCPL